MAGSKGSRSPLVLLQAAHVNYNPSAQTVQDRTLEPVTTYASRTTSDRGESRSPNTCLNPQDFRRRRHYPRCFVKLTSRKESE